MLKEERKQHMLQQIGLYHKVSTAALCRQLKVSLDTIRRDLTELQKADKLVKVHGGAVGKSFHIPFQQPRIYAQQEKISIVRKTIPLIQDGMNILLGGGTVVLELARRFPENLKVTVYTISPLIALEIAQRSKAEVVVLAGKLHPNAYVATGSALSRQISRIRADLGIIGAQGISPGFGLSESDWEIAEIKEQILRASKRSAVLTIAEKLDTERPIKIAELRQLDYLITELSPGDPRLQRYRRSLQLR